MGGAAFPLLKILTCFLNYAKSNCKEELHFIVLLCLGIENYKVVSVKLKYMGYLTKDLLTIGSNTCNMNVDCKQSKAQS